MRIGYVLGLITLGLFGTGTSWAQGGSGDAPVAAPAAADSPAPPSPGYSPPGYPPPPPGYGPGYAAPPEERTANNAIYLELLGPGLLYSVNYDRAFGDFAGRVGFSYLSLSVSSGTSTNGAEAHASFITVPITVSYIGLGSKKHMFEVGAGATIVHAGAGASTFAADKSKTASESDTFLLGNMTFGYRLQPPGGGFMLRTGLSPIFGGGSFIPLPYLALGGTF